MPLDCREYAEVMYQARAFYHPRVIGLVQQIQRVAGVDHGEAIDIVAAVLPGHLPENVLRVAQAFLAELKKRPDLIEAEASVVVEGDVRLLAEQAATELREWLWFSEARNFFRFYAWKTRIDPYELGRRLAGEP